MNRSFSIVPFHGTDETPWNRIFGISGISGILNRASLAIIMCVDFDRCAGDAGYAVSLSDTPASLTISPGTQVGLCRFKMRNMLFHFCFTLEQDFCVFY